MVNYSEQRAELQLLIKNEDRNIIVVLIDRLNDFCKLFLIDKEHYSQ